MEILREVLPQAFILWAFAGVGHTCWRGLLLPNEDFHQDSKGLER